MDNFFDKSDILSAFFPLEFSLFAFFKLPEFSLTGVVVVWLPPFLMIRFVLGSDGCFVALAVSIWWAQNNETKREER